MVDRIVEASETMGMRINADKTEIQFLGAGDKQFQVKAMGQQLQQTGDFVYLGGSAQKMGQRVISREELDWQDEFFRP
jgi:hypothetical protein